MKQYVMKGNPETKRLQQYHMILGITKSCKLRCRHCYVEGIRRDNHSIPVETAKKAIQEFSAIAKRESEGRAIVHLKGGEPFDDAEKLEELALFISGLGLNLFITTNGMAVCEKLDMLKRIHESTEGRLRISLSLNGSKEEIDSILRVGRKPFQASVRAANDLAAAGIAFDINYVLHEGNLGDLKDMVELSKSLGSSQLNLLQLIVSGQTSGNGLKKADPKMFLESLVRIYENADQETKAALAGSVADVIGRMKAGNCSRECVAGYRGLLYVNPDGNVSSCPSSNQDGFIAGKIGASSVKELMDSDALGRLRNLKILPGCKGDILSGGEVAKRLSNLIRAQVGERSGEANEAICIQKNF